MSAAADQPTTVRSGEELDTERLASWLGGQLPRFAGLDATAIHVDQFPAGHSNLTYLLTIKAQGVAEELVLRRPPFGKKARGAHDMGREYRLLSGLRGHYAAIPEPIATCDGDDVLGAPFYLMRRVAGVILRKRLPADIAADVGLVERIHTSFVTNFAAIHAVDWEAAGLTDLYRGDGYVARQIGGWTRRYERAKTDEIAAIDQVAAWLADNMPADSGSTLVHNDYKHDNLVLDPRDPTRIVGVLDWEMATIGCPLMDLGTTLGYWVEAGDPAPLKAFAFCPSYVPGAPTRAELVAAYEAASGRQVDAPVFYFAYGLFKLAVVAQQIYRRYADGATSDPRFAMFIEGVKLLGAQAAKAIETGQLSGAKP